MTDPSSGPSPKFLADRCLGKSSVSALRALGWDIVRLSEIYPGDAQEVSDIELVLWAGSRGMSVLTKDKKIRYQPSFKQACGPVFSLAAGQLAITEAVARFDAGRSRIWAAASAFEASFWIVYEAGRVERRA